jgi:ferredoxin
MNNLASTPYSVIDHPERGQVLIDFYQTVKNRDGFDFWAEDLYWALVLTPRLARINAETQFERILKNAYVNAQRTHNPHNATRVGRPPASDFAGCNPTRYEVKDPKEMSRLIKKVGHLFGSPLVRITRMNPDWYYDRGVLWPHRGFARGEPIEIQPHWEFAIVVGTPLMWETINGSPIWNDSHDTYGWTGTFTTKMTAYIKSLGWPARPNGPCSGYEVNSVPILVDAGVGEQGRLGICVAPEFGAAFRSGIILTNLPLEPDKPIDFGLRKFCERCQICAEHCPTQALTYGGVKEINGRGYEGWVCDVSKCHNAWHQVPGGIPPLGYPGSGCRICQSVCPFTQKSNWVHKVARDIAYVIPRGFPIERLFGWKKLFTGQIPLNTISM